MMNMRDWLLRAFEYDLWANRKWLKAIDELGRADQAIPIVEHILGSQTLLLRRIEALRVPEPNPDIVQSLLDLNACWMAQVRERDSDERIAFRTGNGMEFDLSFGEIALHVVNHGTYHRGQLRGLFNDADLRLVPDTDLVYFFADKDAAK